MRRRELLGVIGVAAAWPVVARAQQGTVIAILGTGAADSPSSKTQIGIAGRRYARARPFRRERLRVRGAPFLGQNRTLPRPSFSRRAIVA